MVAAAAAAWTAAGAPHIFDWGIRDLPYEGHYVPVPHIGHDWYATSPGSLPPVFVNLYTTLHAQGLPIALMLRDDTGPLYGTKDRNALANTILWLRNQGWRLDYVFADIETANTYAEYRAICNIVRSNADPNINGAYIGLYPGYAGNFDLSVQFLWLTNRSADSALYLETYTNANSEIVPGQNVSNPACYPYAYYTAHATSTWPAEQRSPNDRSALFWAPLERLSLAKRNLPAGHRLMPWMAAFVPWSGYPAPAPTYEDRQALLRHFRLRGTDSYYVLNSGNPDLSDADYRAELRATWTNLDSMPFRNSARRQRWSRWEGAI
jgi:hypothetical protein